MTALLVLTMLGVCLPGASASAQTVTCFSAPTPPEVAVGNVPVAIATGDVNKDGLLDFVTANGGSGTLSIRLGDGAGHFSAPSPAEIPSSLQTQSVALGDFNGDGNPDLIFNKYGAPSVALRLGDGSGHFTTPATSEFAVGNGPTAVAAGDFNNDGKLDFLSMNNTASTVSVRLGDGAGGFSAPAGGDTAVGSNPIQIALGDFNNDGRLDFATANSVGMSVSIRLGNGAGGFTSPAVPEIGFGITMLSVALGDFNNDGRLDFAAGKSGTFGLGIFLGDGAGGFTMALSGGVESGDQPFSIAVGDINGDGLRDVVVASFNSNNVPLRLGAGAGAFTTPSPANYTAGNRPYAVAIGQVNGDGALDVLITNQASGNVSVRLNSCDPNAPPTVAVPGAQTVAQGGTVTFAAASGTGITVADADIGAFTAQVTVTASHGALTLGSTGGLGFSVGDGTDDPTMTFTGTLAQLNAALNGLHYTPSTGYAGPDEVTVAVSDLGRSGFDGPKTAGGSVTITVTPAQTPPTPPSPPTQTPVTPIGVTTSVASGKLQARVVAPEVPGQTNLLREIRFGPLQNARVTIGGQEIASGQTYTVPAGTTAVDFTVERVTPGQPTTVPFTVVDGRGEWRTFVGGGPTAGF